MLSHPPDWDGTCFVCALFAIDPPSPAVDPRLAQDDEAEALCARHRARMTEGLCVLCGRTKPWMDVSSESWIGVCRACFVEKRGETEALKIEVGWQDAEPRGDTASYN